MTGFFDRASAYMSREEVCPSCSAVVPLDRGKFVAHRRFIPQEIHWGDDVDPQQHIRSETCPMSGRLAK